MSDDLQWALEGPPVGTWRTFGGTFDVMMQDTLTLAEDGTGWLLTRSVLRGEELVPVMWRHPQPGLLELAALFPDDDPAEEPAYERVPYRVETVRRDVGGPQAVLQNEEDDVFWTLMGPVALADRVPQAPPKVG